MLFKKGAEANLYLEYWHNRKVLIKKRLPKKYRIPELDRRLRYQRTIHEPQMIHKAKEGGVSTPVIFMIDLAEATIIMEFVEGEQVKQTLDLLSLQDRNNTCQLIGQMIGKLHKSGIIHGDLTTSNMIITPNNRLVLVDFGLSEFSSELEARGVDLHLMKRALQSTHYTHDEECFEAIIAGYAEIMGEKTKLETIRKVQEIERRGRYVSRG